MYRSKSESGFTLIELVIVIVILGILAAVAIPKYEDMREQARVATIKGQLGSIRSAVAIQYARNALNGSATSRRWTERSSRMDAFRRSPSTTRAPSRPTPGVDNTGGWQYTGYDGIVKINVCRLFSVLIRSRSGSEVGEVGADASTLVPPSRSAIRGRPRRPAGRILCASSVTMRMHRGDPWLGGALRAHARSDAERATAGS